MKAFIEQDCKIEHEGKVFESGGSYIVECEDGKYRGVVYVQESRPREITTWAGEHIAYIDRYTLYRGNFCKMARVTFTLGGKKFIGEYCPDLCECVRVRSTK